MTFLLLQVEIEYFFKQHFNVGVGSQDPTDGRGYFSGREAGGRDLVEQRLEGVVVSAVDDRDLYGKSRDSAGGGQASEAGSYDYDPRSRLAAHTHIRWSWPHPYQ